MARTAPAPDIPPIPGMCPSMAVLAGGGDGGGGSGGSAGDGNGDENAAANQGGENAEADSRDAPDPQKYPDCGTASHPIDVVTGRAFTHPIVDLRLPGPLPLTFARVYSSKMAGRDAGLGFGWGHTFGWEIEVERRRIKVWNDQGVAVEFPMIRKGDEVIGPWGWVLRRETWGFAVDADDGCWRLFSAAEDGERRFRLTAIEDRNRNRIALAYEDGRLVEVRDSAGRIIRIVPTREGRMGSIQVQNAASQGQWVAFATYGYDEHGNLTSVTDADGFAWRYAYDEDHRLTLDQDRTGLTFHFVYDREGRAVEGWGDYPGKRDPSLAESVPRHLHDGLTRVKGIHHVKLEYGKDGYSEVVDSTQVRRFYGTRHGTLGKSVAGGAVVTAKYDDDGHMLARTNETGATTSFERDRRGRLLKVTDPLGRVTAWERDANGLPVSAVDPSGGVWQAERDARGNALITTDPAGHATSRRYDERGLVTEAVTARGTRSTCAYDAHGNAVAVTAPNGGTFRFTYDALGRLLCRVDPLGAETRYAYSARGDLIQVRDALGGVTRYSYDGEGQLIQVVDPKGNVTQLIWGGYHKLCARKDPNGNVVQLRYNLEGELVEVHNERGEVHRFEHDASGRLTGETTFDGRVLRYKSDLSGRIVRVTNGVAQATKLTYDAAGHLVKREYWDDSADEFTYNERGEIVACKGPAGELVFERDPLGRVVREIQLVGGVEHWVEARYDALGDRVERRTSLGHEELVTRGLLGERARTVLDGTHAVEHTADRLGRESTRALPGGGWIESLYDALGRVSRRRAGGVAPTLAVKRGEPDWLGERPAGTTVDTGYRYDGDGLLMEAWDRARGSTQYQYDPVGQMLARVPEGARGEVFAYDATGNLVRSGAEPETWAYAKGNRLVRKGVVAYAWDDDGRVVEKRGRNPEGTEEVWRYTWNGAGLLEKVEQPDGTRVEFAYDPFARRVSKRVSRPDPATAVRTRLSDTRFVWDGDVLVHEIRVAARAAGDPVIEERTYCFEDGSHAPVAHRERRRQDVAGEQGAWFHYVNDPIGTPERLVDGDGAVVCELTRHGWAGLTPDAGSTASTPLRFQGQYDDEETGLRYNRFRYFDPVTGRFWSADPVGLRGSVNDFCYAPNTVSWIDPLGLTRSVSTATLLLPDGNGGYTSHALGPFAATAPGPDQHSERAIMQAAKDQAQNTRPNAQNPLEGAILRIHQTLDPCPPRNNGARSCQTVLQQEAATNQMRIEITSDQNNQRKGVPPKYKGRLPTWVVDRRPGELPVNPDPGWAK